MSILRESLNFILQFLEGLSRANSSVIAVSVRKKIYRTSCMIDTNVYITNKDNFCADYKSALYHGTYILNNHGKFYIGKNSHLGAYCYVNVCYGNVSLGDDVAIGPGTKIIAYSNHYAKGKKITEERKIGEIIIGNNVFIGANCTILPDTIVHDNVIVAAGSVVKGELESNSIYGGMFCRKIKSKWYA